MNSHAFSFLHEKFIFQIDKFLKGQKNTPDQLIPLEDKFIHDNSYFIYLFSIIEKIKIQNSDPEIEIFANIINYPGRSKLISIFFAL